VIAVTTLIAATVNGGLGYGFGSITVPVALLYVGNKTLNPALVAIELGINLACLFWFRRAVPAVWRRVAAMGFGLLPGVVVGSTLLANASASAIKLGTYLVLLPLIVLQSAGLRRPVKDEKRVGPWVGAGVGALYATTTISGPPLALLFNNQGLQKDEFRAALSLFRTSEALLTVGLYASLGLFASPEVWALAKLIVPFVIVGLPLGRLLFRNVQSETFRRIAMALDAVLVGFGLARVSMELASVPPVVAWGVFAAVVLIEAVLVIRYFSNRPALPPAPAPSQESLA